MFKSNDPDQISFFSVIFLLPCHSLPTGETLLFFDETQYMRGKMCQGSDPGPRSEMASVDFSSNAVSSSQPVLLSVRAYLP